jgi:hypothetical protein
MKNATYARAIAAAVLGLASLSAQAITTPSNLLGSAAPAEQAQRTINVDGSTRAVNVQFGETVRFNANGQSFTVKFDGTRNAFALNQLAPAGTLDHAVKVYVAHTRFEYRIL